MCILYYKAACLFFISLYALGLNKLVSPLYVLITAHLKQNKITLKLRQVKTLLISYRFT